MMVVPINAGKGYDVTIENGVFKRAPDIISKHVTGCRIMIVSETNVYPIYGAELEKMLKAAGYKIYRFVFEAGESSKTLHTVSKLYRMLAECGFSRSDIILTLGGGVAGDMGGFAAATYMRGIDFIQMPTSLLAQVDASVGGKTGVDLPEGKNLVGAFHQPLAVISDPEFIKTLPAHFVRDGMGEVIKYACIHDKSMVQSLIDGYNYEKLDYRDIVHRSILCKKYYIEEDCMDKGTRMILNFGHTFGHAIEKLSGFKDISHGEAVAMGMVIAARAGEKLGITKPGTADEIKELVIKSGLRAETEFSAGDIAAAALNDKKSEGEMVNLVLLKEIGSAVLHKVKKEDICGLIS